MTQKSKQVNRIPKSRILFQDCLQRKWSIIGRGLRLDAYLTTKTPNYSVRKFNMYIKLTLSSTGVATFKFYIASAAGQ